MKQAFVAEIKKHTGIDGAYVEIPFDVEQVFGAKRVKVKAWFDGMEYRGSIVRMGGCYLIGLTQALRQEIGKSPGDTVGVVIEKDTEERVVPLPEDFSTALEQCPAAKEAYAGLSYSHKKEYWQWITEAKRPETRASRIAQTIDRLQTGNR